LDDNEITDLLWKFALLNSVKFGGTPNPKAIMGKIMAERKDLRSQSRKVMGILESIINKLNSMDLDSQTNKLMEIDPSALDKKETKKEEKELPDLPEVSKYKNVVMRLAPYPSGALHIGNARMIVLNDEYVKRYGGKLILFFDDTIGSPKSLRNSPKAKYVLPESYDLIREDLDWLKVVYNKVYYKSDRLEIFYEYCERLIKDKLAYVCSCSAEEFRDSYKLKQSDCPHRNQTIQKNLQEWDKMLSGEYHETEAVVRLKTGMNQKDPALRDQIIMRISEAEHPRVGNKYKVWPMLEFSWAIDDHLIGVTHILRGSDLIKEDFIENFVWEHFNWKKAQFLHYGRINFPEMKLSKTDARNNIQNGIYYGWDDPRTWTLQSLKKRGIQPEALRESLLDLGMSISGITFSVNWLYSKNQDLIDDRSDRYFFVEAPIKVEIKEVPKKEFTAKPLLLPTKPEKGTRNIKITAKDAKVDLFISTNDLNLIETSRIIRLKDLFNIQIDSIEAESKLIHAHYHSPALDRNYSIIQWVPVQEHISVEILKPDGKISKGEGEINLEKIPMEVPIQFERYGFVNPIRRDNKLLFCYFTH
jgi:glutamyl-tRNA synthetase